VEQSQGGLLMSEDGGRSWKQVFDPRAYVYGATWHTMKGYDFHWGHRPVIDPHDQDKVYLTTSGSSFWHGRAVAEDKEQEQGD
jgi:hypothetical protein